MESQSRSIWLSRLLCSTGEQRKVSWIDSMVKGGRVLISKRGRKGLEYEGDEERKVHSVDMTRIKGNL